tara:strand:- start:434 stop:574 length:141 start_codon:yes stop_codon:yes gene_type:complete
MGNKHKKNTSGSRKYHKELKKAVRQHVIKKTNANAEWLKKHLIVLT